MKSHPYAKTTGGRVSPASSDEASSRTIELLPSETPPASTLEPLASKTFSSSICSHIDARGHRCRMLVADPKSSLCPHHQQQHRKAQRRQHEALAKDLIGDVKEFCTAGSVNFFLSNLIKQLARKRIARRDALALAYISQLTLNSLAAVERESEADDERMATQFFLNGLRRGPQQQENKNPEPGNGQQ